MHAIVTIAGQQTKVEAKKLVYAHKFLGNVGTVVELGYTYTPLTDDNCTLRGCWLI